MYIYMCAYSALFILLVYIFTCTYVGTYVQQFKPAELSRPALISYPIKCVFECHAQPTDIDIMVIYASIRMYVHTYNSQHICVVQHWLLASPSFVHTHTDGVKKYESSFRVRMWCPCPRLQTIFFLGQHCALCNIRSFSTTYFCSWL